MEGRRCGLGSTSVVAREFVLSFLGRSWVVLGLKVRLSFWFVNVLDVAFFFFFFVAVG